MTSWNKQIENRNFLSPIGFRFLLAKFPKVAYFCQSANIPAMTLSVPEQSTMFRPLPMDGFISYDQLTLQFIIDEDMQNYLILHNWMRALGQPDGKSGERKRLMDEMSRLYGADDADPTVFADATLTILNSNFNMNMNIVFQDLFPVSLSGLDFSAIVDGSEYATATATFRYTGYEFRSGESTQRDKTIT